MKRIRTYVALLAACGAAAALSAPARAGDLSVTVRNRSGGAVADAVVYAVAVDSQGRARAGTTSASIDQVDKEYVPYVTAVQKGTKVSFPNRDQIRHHVYSFSDAKTFEIPLYKGTPREPILFDTPGVVALGCNIHDWMKAYVFVTETPYFAITDDSGRASLGGLTGSNYQLRVWHPRQKGAGDGKQVSVSGSGGQSEEIVIDEKRVWRPRRAPSAGGSSYR